MGESERKRAEFNSADSEQHVCGSECTCSKCSTSGNGAGGFQGSDMMDGNEDDDGESDFSGTRKKSDLIASNILYDVNKLTEVTQSTGAKDISGSSQVVLSYMNYAQNHNTDYTDSVEPTNLPSNDGRRGLTDLATRIKTFRFWQKPHVATGEELARCGFYFLEDKDRVKCVYCNLILKDWESGDNPITEHKRFSQFCQFEQYMAVESSTSNSMTEPSLGISYERPKFPDFAVEHNRLKTFTEWPHNKSQTKEEMAKAGFFFVGQPDRVMCFYCGLRLHNWLDGDEPWFEHARHGSKCTYVRHCKDEHFVTQVKEAVEKGQRHLYPVVQIPPAVLPFTVDKQLTIPIPAKKQKLNIEQYMNTPSVRSLLEIMMVSKDLVIKALTRCLAKSDVCPDASTLMEYVYQIEDEEEAAECKAEAADSHELTEEEPNAGSAEPSSHIGACGTLADENISRQTFQTLFPVKSPEVSYSPAASTGGLLASTQTATLPHEEVQHILPEPIETSSGPKDPLDITENHRPKILLSQDPEDETDEDEDIYGEDVRQSQMPALNRQQEEEELSKLKSENEELEQERRCKICLDEMASILFLPCGHLVCCSSCSPAVRLCPICRKLIQGTVRTFRV